MRECETKPVAEFGVELYMSKDGDRRQDKQGVFSSFFL